MQHGPPPRMPSFDSEGSMDRSTPLQHLLRNLLPSRSKANTAPPEFMDTRPEPAVHHLVPRRPTSWAESAIELEMGTDIMEYPEDTAADLMDEFFASSEKRAA